MVRESRRARRNGVYLWSKLVKPPSWNPNSPSLLRRPSRLSANSCSVWRRHTRYQPRITFPCGGFYHCLSLFDAEDENIADLSLSTGRFHPFKALTHVAEQWPEPRSYCLAAVGQGYGIERVLEKEILAVLGLPIRRRSKIDPWESPIGQLGCS